MADISNEKELWKRFLQVVPSLKTLNQWSKEAKIQVEGFRPGQVTVKEKLVASIINSSINFNKMKKFLKKLLAKTFATEEAKMLVQGYSEEALLSLVIAGEEEQLSLIMAELLVEEMSTRQEIIAQMLAKLEQAQRQRSAERDDRQVCGAEDVERKASAEAEQLYPRERHQQDAHLGQLKPDRRVERRELRKEKQKMESKCKTYQAQLLQQQSKIEELEHDKQQLLQENSALKLVLQRDGLALMAQTKEGRVVIGTEMKEYRKVLEEQQKYEVRFINVLTDQLYTDQTFLAQQAGVLVLEATLPLRNLQKIKAMRTVEMQYIKTVEALKRALR